LFSACCSADEAPSSKSEAPVEVEFLPLLVRELGERVSLRGEGAFFRDEGDTLPDFARLMVVEDLFSVPVFLKFPLGLDGAPPALAADDFDALLTTGFNEIVPGRGGSCGSGWPRASCSRDFTAAKLTRQSPSLSCFAIEDTSSVVEPILPSAAVA